MNKRDSLNITLIVALFGVAAFFLVRFLRDNDGISEKAFFYDLSEKKLFKAPRTAIPPIKGINDAEEDAVRAVVISVTGQPEKKSSWKIAYLEKYSPDLKREMEIAQATGGSPPMGRGLAQAHRFVSRVNNSQWFSLSTPQGEQIVNEWATPGTNGITPVVCTP